MPTTLSNEEVFGTAGLSHESVFPPEDKTAVADTPWRMALESLGGSALSVVKALPAAADMLAGAPAGLVSQIKGAGAQINEVFQGGTKKQQEEAGAKAKYLGHPVLEAFKTPFQSAVKSLTGAEHYDQEVVSKALDAVAEKVSEYSGGMLTAYDVNELLGATMNAMGVKGISEGVKYARARQIESAANKELAKMPTPKEEIPHDEVFGPDLSSIPEPVVVTPKILKQMFADAKNPSNAVDNLFAAAREGKFPQKAPKPLDESLPPSGEPKGRLPGEGVIIGDAAQSGWRKLVNGEAPDLTAEERIALSDIVKPRQLVGADGKPIHSQGGFSDPAHLAKIAALTGLGIAGVSYLRDNHPDVLTEFRSRVRSMLGMKDEGQEQRNRDAERQRLRNDEQQKFEDRLNNGYEPPASESVDGNPLAGTEKLIPFAAMAGAIKAKGGMWHPEAVKRLAQPLTERLTGLMGYQRGIEPFLTNREAIPEIDLAEKRADWSTKAVKNYLNKHAGTESDPLRDVEIPFEQGTKRWEDLMDIAIKSDEQPNPKTGAPEKVFNIEPGGPRGWHGAASSINDYLSHVGDFLRQNVDPAKLSQYDLVRAVKETAANDARVAKEMERAAGDSTKQLPVYKDYGDGMKWVELKLPEKLTEEQAKGVEQFGKVPGLEKWRAVDKDGKPIRNSYTEEEAVGNTPEEAYLAGRLAEEGNQLGHCVGGYCDAVASGESKIYSLRDAKGKSHVTVEVEPPSVYPLSGDKLIARLGEAGRKAWEDYAQNHKGENLDQYLSREHPDLLKQLEKGPESILQIKGKQNRAPASTYLPYVQDFVRSGKWGEVGDLEGTGLKRGKDIFKYDDFRKAAESTGIKFEPDRFYTKEEIDAEIDKGGDKGNDLYASRNAPGFNQRGSVDPALLARIAAVALGAAVGASVSDNKLLGAVIGGVGLGAATKLNARGATAAIKNAFAADSRIRINQFADEHDAGMARAARAIWQQASAVAEAAPKAADRVAITHAIQNGREVSAALRPAMQKARDFFGAMAQAGQDAGVLKGLIDNYVTNLWDLTGKNKSKWEEILGHAGGPSMSPESRFALKRKIQNLEEGKALGLVPQTEDVAQIMSIYGNSLARSMENKKMLAALKSATVPGSEQKLVIPSAKAPHSYVTIDHPQMSGIRVHPDIAPSMKFIFDNSDPGTVMAGLQGINTAIKRSAVSFSLFHAKALVDAQVGAHGVLKGIPRAVKGLAQAAVPKLFGENTFLRQMREGGAGDIIDKAQTGGLKISLEKGKLADEDLNGSFYTMLKGAQQGLDSIVPGLGLPVKGITALNHAVDTFMWERLHAGMKLGTFAEKLEVLRNSDAKAAAREGRPPKAEAELAEQAASFTNDIYGGLNWRKLGEEAKTKWGRNIALSVYSPKGRQALQLLVFAPDWTISTTRAMTRTFGGLAGYEKGSGARGILEPQNATDLHRQYLLRSAVYYALVGDAINYSLSGHHLWDNKDPTMIDMGDGRTMQWSKHSMEPIHWVTKPGQQALNKLAFLPKEAANQMLGTEYLSAAGHAPRLDTSPSGRLAHVGKSLMPIAGQQAFGEKASQGGAVAGFLGAPIYGKTFEEREAAKAERARKRVLERIEKRRREAR